MQYLTSRYKHNKSKAINTADKYESNELANTFSQAMDYKCDKSGSSKITLSPDNFDINKNTHWRKRQCNGCVCSGITQCPNFMTSNLAHNPISPESDPH